MSDLRSPDDLRVELERPLTAQHEKAKHRANMLLDKILLENSQLLDSIAEALVASRELIRQYQAGLMIPIERQMLLAAYAIELSPAYARLGYRLRGQLRAAIAFAARETETHNEPPSGGSRWG